jgi:hypothetical protein
VRRRRRIPDPVRDALLGFILAAIVLGLIAVAAVLIGGP